MDLWGFEKKLRLEWITIWKIYGKRKEKRIQKIFTVQELIEQLSEREEKELKQSADDLLKINQQVIQFQFKIFVDLLDVLKGIWRKGIWNKIIWGRVKFIDIGTMDEILRARN